VYLIAAALNSASVAQEVVLHCDPAQTKADFTLGDPLHTVRGNFHLKSGELHYDAAAQKISG